VSEVEHWSPVNCPACGGFLIHNRRGRVIGYRDPGGDLFQAWLRTRFAGPHWEPAPIKDNGRIPPAVPELSGRERETADSLQQSPALARLARMPRETALAAGLDYVYIGNVPGHEGENTFCPNCGNMLIRRVGFIIDEMRLVDGHCPDCDTKIPGRWH
jgi:predicted RNA-binding Zn-ribbon protein involved in translation (DUF1610 family)